MLEKSQIIDLAWLELGEQNQLYNINISDRLAIAGTLFDQVVRELAVDSNFMFNAKTVKLNLNLNSTNDEGEFRYNRPVDYKNRIWFSDRLARMEGEFIYSTAKDLRLCYCYDMQFADYPDSIQNLLVLKLAQRLAKAYDVHYDKLGRIEGAIKDETNRILISEGLPFPIPR